MILEKPKPARRGALAVFDDGREVCNLQTSKGRRIYRERVVEMWHRQSAKCCVCRKYLAQYEATFEHEFGRGMGGGKRDDRIVLPDGTPINGASHGLCNNERGSKRTPIWHGERVA